MKYQDIRNYKYRLAETFIIKTNIKGRGFKHELFSLDDDGNLTIVKGYLWDGVSGPTWDTKSTMISGLVHDAFYQSIRLELIPIYIKHEIDALFYGLMIEHEVWKIRARYFYIAVDELGHNSCIPGDIRIPRVIEV